MKESFQSRREAAAEQYEDTEEYKARERLVEIGVFKKVSDLDLYHGRAGDGTKNWEVQPNFNNSGNKTGNYNINKRPALNTGNYEVAKEFSEARARQTNRVAEVHKIESLDPDAMIIDLAALRGLTKEARTEVNKLLKTLSPGPITGAPLSYDDRNSLDHAAGPRDFQNSDGLMYTDDIEAIARKIKADPHAVKHVGSAQNTYVFIGGGWLEKVCFAFSDNESNIRYRNHNAPINHEYFANWLRTNHIIGCKMGVDSATLDWKHIDNYLLFDLEKVNTPEKNEEFITNRNRLFGKVAYAMGEKIKNRQNADDIGEKTNNQRTEFVKLLTENLYAKPDEIIEAAKKTPGFEKVFDEDAGNWEGYSLGEHTETVLRIFDDNYADTLPADSLPVMRLALLVHDIGKGEAVKARDKSNQDKYNYEAAEKFMDENNIDKNTQGLVLMMIGKGKSLASDYIRAGSKEERDVISVKMSKLCASSLKYYLNIEPTNDTVTGMRLMLKGIQNCDSAAYTTMGITRAKKSNGIISYRNYKSFNGSFDPFHGFTGRRVRMR